MKRDFKDICTDEELIMNQLGFIDGLKWSLQWIDDDSAKTIVLMKIKEINEDIENET